MQQESFEWPLLLMNIMNQWFVPYSTDGHVVTSDRDSLSESFLSFILEKYIVCDVCGLRSSSFETASVFYITLTNNPSCKN